MKIAFAILLGVLTFLAVSSGMTKILLMQQDVEFFGRYGFSETLLITFGAAQLIGGVFLLFSKTRFAGAAIVASTFLVSLVILLMEGNIPVSIATVSIPTILMSGNATAAPTTKPAWVPPLPVQCVIAVGDISS